MTTRTTRARTTLAAALLSIGLLAAACSSDKKATSAAAPTTQSVAHDHAAGNSAPAAVQLRQDMRKLWEDHVTWTRLFIVSAVAGLPDTDTTAARLLQNQTDIGDAVATYYGKDAGAQLTALLRDHILIAADLLTAAKANDTAAVTAKHDAWYANAHDIAAFLASANPAWPADTLEQMMREHLDGTLAEATARLTADWHADVVAYDRVHAHILTMADALTAGIVQQFPDRFNA